MTNKFDQMDILEEEIKEATEGGVEFIEVFAYEVESPGGRYLDAVREYCELNYSWRGLFKRARLRVRGWLQKIRLALMSKLLKRK